MFLMLRVVKVTASGTISVTTNPTFSGSAVTSGANNRGHTHDMQHKHTTGGMSTHETLNFAVKNMNNNMRAPMISFSNSHISSLAYKDTNPNDYFYCSAGTTTLQKGTSLVQSSGTSAVQAVTNYYGWYDGTLTFAHTHTTNSLTNASGTAITNTGGESQNHTHSVTASGTISGGAYKFTGSAVTSGAESQNHTHTVTASGTNANSGGGEAHNNMPPYVVKYCWQRTA